MFFKLRIYHNNRNKSINFVVMWNQANNKKIIDAAGNSDAGGDDKLNLFFCGLMKSYLQIQGSVNEELLC